MTNLLITISGEAIALCAFAVIGIYLLLSYMKKDREYMDGELGLNKSEEQKHSSNTLFFTLENNSDETLQLDLCRLDDKDGRYKFSTSAFCDYEKLISYLKAYSINVFNTKVVYTHKNWQDDVIYNIEALPFTKKQTPILLAFNDFNKHQFQREIIDSQYPYTFDYFNSLEITIKPKEKKTVSLIVSNKEIPEKNKRNPVCALIVKNNSDKVERVRLFDREYFNEILEVGKIEIESPFRDISYEDVLRSIDANPLIAKSVKLFFGDRNIDSIFKVNFDEHKISEYITSSQFQIETIDFDLKDDSYIASFEIDVEPNSTIYIAFNS